MQLEDYVKANHPNVMEEHKRFVRGFVPSIGSELIYLVDDANGSSGQSLEVIGYSALGCGMDVFIDLKNQSNGTCSICSFKNWHEKVKLIKGEYLPIGQVKFNDS
ncbi:hypothetical protein V7087_28390 [Neobacillus niacini]|uniref:hypothetical protein n=1 Tax=Neobacillus niacini TaxID=86668 RepID=UPI0005EF0C0C|nr:hypothetical protein [Neobacillus niacini]